MTVGILQCGAPPGTLAERHGTYGEMVRRMLGPGRGVRIYDVTKGELPPGGPTECGSYVLTGSPAGVYEDLPWIPPLLGFLREAKGRAKLVGICFGHQAMTQAFGGEVIKSPNGWGVGVQRYELRHCAPWMAGNGDATAMPAYVDVPASHQDQVVQPPPGARVVAANAFTPHAALDYGDAISFQFHPEFDPLFGAALVEERRDKYGVLADAALTSYQRPNDCIRIGHWISCFLDAPAALAG